MTPDLYIEIAKLALVGIIITALTSTFNTWRHRVNELRKAQLAKDTAIEIALGNRAIELEKAELSKQTAIEIAYIEKNANLEKYFIEHEIERISKLQEDWIKINNIVSTFVYHKYSYSELKEEDKIKYQENYRECIRIRNEMKLLGIKTSDIQKYTEASQYWSDKTEDKKNTVTDSSLKVVSQIYDKYNELREQHLRKV